MGFDETIRRLKPVVKRNNRPLTPKLLYEFSSHATPESLLKSAQFLHRDLPIRIAKRLDDFQGLPFIIACNPHLRKVYDLYAEAFDTLHRLPPLSNSTDQEKYTSLLSQYLDNHMNIITLLARGVKEARRYEESSQILNTFLNRTILSRIGIRILIENQLALARQAEQSVDNYAGVICRRMDPIPIIRKMEKIAKRMCREAKGHAPDIVLDGDLEAVVSYVPAHLEYILQELFKNAFRAVVEHHGDDPSVELPPVRITLCRNTDAMILRISDQGGGMSPQMLAKCWEWSFTTANDDDADNVGLLGDIAKNNPNDGQLAGLGFGMPMSKMYSEYFGGSLQVVSMNGYGTDVYLTLTNLDTSAVHRMA